MDIKIGDRVNIKRTDGKYNSIINLLSIFYFIESMYVNSLHGVFML